MGLTGTEGLLCSEWAGIVAPKNTPAVIIVGLNAAVNAVIAAPTMKARFTEIGATAFPGSSAEFGKFIADETEKWAKVIRAANIKLE